MLYAPDHIDALRIHELDKVAAAVGGLTGPLLEIGGGSGRQARILSEAVGDLVSLDVSRRAGVGEHYPITIYDGRNLPFGEGQFNTVFSSHTLEHVKDLNNLLGETRRVLVSGGMALHVLPSATWRLWTTLAHYPAVIRLILRRLRGAGEGLGRVHGPPAVPRRHDWVAILNTLVAPKRHGVDGNVITEMYYFSRLRWRTVFARAGWRVVRIVPLSLFYTGYGAGSGWLSMGLRRGLAGVMGSSSMLYVLRRDTEAR